MMRTNSARLFMIVLSLLVLEGCQKKDQFKVDIKEEKVLVAKAEHAVRKANHSQAAEELENLVKFYPNSPEHQTYYLELMYSYYRAADYQQSRDVAERFLINYPYAKHNDYVWFIQLKSILKLIKPNWFAQRIYKEGDTVGSKLVDEGIAVANTLINQRPDSVYLPQAISIKNHLIDRLARRHCQIAEFYHRKGAYLASEQRLADCLAMTKDSRLVKKSKNISMQNRKLIKA